MRAFRALRVISHAKSMKVLTAFTFLAEIVLTVLMCFAETVLTLLIFLPEMFPAILTVLTEITLAVLMFLTENCSWWSRPWAGRCPPFPTCS